MPRLSDPATIELIVSAARSVTGSPWKHIHCPACGSRRRSLSVHEHGRFSCWRCGAWGRTHDAPAFVETVPERVVLDTIPPPRGFVRVFDGPGAAAESTGWARTYLAGRGITEEVGRAAELGCCTEGYYAGRVVVPVLSPDASTWTGWVARDATGHAVDPYLYPKGMARGTQLYNQRALWADSTAPLLVVEGCFDALALGPDAVAVFGMPTADQLDLLAESARPVVFVLDGDAWRRGTAAAWQLRLSGHAAGSVRLPPETDPDEVSREWLTAQAELALQEG